MQGWQRSLTVELHDMVAAVATVTKAVVPSRSFQRLGGIVQIMHMFMLLVCSASAYMVCIQ